MLKRLLFLPVFLFLLIGCATQQQEVQEVLAEKKVDTPHSVEKISEPKESQSMEITSSDSPVQGMTFEVHVPQNTLAGDLIKVYVFQKPHRMEKIAPNKYRVFLNETQLFPWENALPVRPDYKIKYRYSRNGWDFYTAEYLQPTAADPNRDTNDYFWTKHGREIAYEPGKIQQDSISRWRFFPEQGMPQRMTYLQPKTAFAPRINNLQFRSGQTIEDLYIRGFHDFFNSTAEHMKFVGYTWVELDPPLQWTEEKGLPKVINDINRSPNYPDDETFLEEVRAHKAAGLKVLIAPQLCCTTLDSKGKSKEWWTAYFQETERFLLHFAQLAEKGKADAFMYAVPASDMGNVPLDINQQWRNIFTNINQVFSGEVGEMVWLLGPQVSPVPKPIPDTSFIQWADQLDFIMVATEFPLSMKDNPSDEELKQGAAAIVDAGKIFYDQFHKSVIFRNGYFNVKHSWKGQSFYQIDSIPQPSEPEARLKESKFEFNAENHARTVHAMFEAIAERPWVIGYFHFGYTHWEYPLAADLSVRGKMAEEVWRKWNEIIYGKKKVEIVKAGSLVPTSKRKTVQQGDFIVSFGNVTIEHQNLTLRGNLIVNGTGRLTITNSDLHFEQEYSQQYRAYIRDNATLEMRNVRLRTDGKWFNFQYQDHAKTVLDNVHGEDCCIPWHGSSDNAKFIINESTVGLTLSQNASVTADRSNLFFELVLSDVQGKFRLPAGHVDSYELRIPQRGAKKMQIQVINSTFTDWGTTLDKNTDVTFVNSKMTIGMNAGSDWQWADKQQPLVHVSGLKNKLYDDHSLVYDTNKLHLVNTSVRDWYPQGFNNAVVEISNSDLADLQYNGGNAKIMVRNSSAQIAIARENVTYEFYDSTIKQDAISHDTARIYLYNTTLEGEIKEVGKGKVIVR